MVKSQVSFNAGVQYSVIIGTGGGFGQLGGASSINSDSGTYIAYGGGIGASAFSSGGAGASGGGGTGSGGGRSGGSASQGNVGGFGNNVGPGGGGGGSGSAGLSDGSGGEGIKWSINGKYYAAGGGGGINYIFQYGLGGSAIGGNGASGYGGNGDGTGGNAVASTGSGGGGGCGGLNSRGGSGSAGIILIAFIQCNAGYWLARSTDTVCSQCIAGTYSAFGDNSCTACPAGMISSSGSASCTSSISPTISPTILPTISPSQSPTFIFSQTPSAGPTPTAVPTTPTARPTVIPFSPVFFASLFYLDGKHYNLYSSLPQALTNTFTFVAWITTSTYPATVVSLGRSAASVGAELVIDLDSTGRLRFRDYSPNTGYGFSARGVAKVAIGNPLIYKF